MLNDRRARLDYVMFAVRHALAELRRRRLADGIPTPSSSTATTATNAWTAR